MSANDYLVEAATRHQIFLQRYAGGQINEVLPILERMAVDIENRLYRATTTFQINRLETLLRDIEAIIQAAGDDMSDTVLAGMRELVEYEAGFTERMLNGVLTAPVVAPSREQLLAAVTNSAARLVQGKNIIHLTVPQMVAQFTEAKRSTVLQDIRASFIAGDAIGETIRKVANTTERSARRQSGALIRTATNHMATEARKQVYQANADVIEREEWVSTLDARTTLTCMGFDGKLYQIDQGPYPPAHFGCRSVRVPRVNPMDTLFTGTGTRASRFGPVSAKRTYGGWLRDQSKEFQDEALGPERAALFRAGKISIDKFTDDQGRVLSLAELRALESLTLQ